CCLGCRYAGARVAGARMAVGGWGLGLPRVGLRAPGAVLPLGARPDRLRGIAHVGALRDCWADCLGAGLCGPAGLRCQVPAEPAVAADGAGMTACRGIMFIRAARLLA